MTAAAPVERAEEVRTRLERAAELLLGYPFSFWHYGDSIGFEGLLAAGDVLGSSRYEGFVHGALKAWAARARPYRELDNTAPGHALCLCYERTGDGTLLEAGRGLAEFLVARPTVEGVYAAFARAPLREPYGGGALPPEEAALLQDPGPGVFVDCLHFDAPFLAHLGALTGDAALVEAAAGQALGAIRLLQEPESGLFHHFYLERTGRAYALGWSRGQGWALLGLLDLLDHLPTEHAARAAVEEAVRRLAQALLERQLPAGGWPALVQDPGAYVETSAALFFASGLARAVDRGLAGEDALGAAGRAWRSGLDAVDGEGRVTGVSAAVWASTALAHYRRVPTGFVVPWGQGPLLVAARERHARRLTGGAGQSSDRDG